MSEEFIIEHCSPTLAGIKTGNMFSVRIKDKTDIKKEVRELNKILKGKGLRVIVLKNTDEYALVYIYRPDHLEKDLKDPQALHILSKRGYNLGSPECCIVQLMDHLKSDDAFPHEIGLFLGYPPSDVDCFMKNPCSGVKCSGCWKAYSDPEKAENTFRRFKRCTEEYREMHKKGKSLTQLAVITNRKRVG